MPAGAPVSLDGLRREGESFMRALSLEFYRAQSGLAARAELRPIYERHAALTSDDALAITREAFLGSTPGSDDHRSARALLEWVADIRVSRALASIDERQMAWESTAMVALEDGRRLPYSRITIDIANTADRAERLMLERARNALVRQELAPLMRERFQRERDLTEELEIANGYVATIQALGGIDLGALVAQCEQFLRDTQSMWFDVAGARVQKMLGIPLRDATRADGIALLRAPELDRFFPAREMEPRVRGQVAEMGSDATAAGRIVYDTGERDGKRSRAFCAPVRIPEEVYLVMRPTGGQQDYRSLLHELGHAMHFAYTRADLPFEQRWLGDNSVTESYAMLFDHQLHDGGWLERYTEVEKPHVPEMLRAVAFEELQLLRRYCAKIIYERELYDGSVPFTALPDLYVETLSKATGFRYDAADAFADVDPRFYSARYLRAWQLQALLRETLIAAFDDDWWRNPRAGPWLTDELFSRGQSELAAELAARVSGQALSFAPLVRTLERML
ncbi:MAG: M3 family metallopeptidase [Gemmatimonadota bacterium]|nr:M3 family metallopeptidase [Gemmatimonadota bacterium]